jgi:hypothetical protein
MPRLEAVAAQGIGLGDDAPGPVQFEAHLHRFGRQVQHRGVAGWRVLHRVAGTVPVHAVCHLVVGVILPGGLPP